jgi:peptide/nickel transport system permease protein
MFEFLLRRIASIIPTLVVVSMLIFGLQQLLPGDPAKILAGEEQDPTVVAYLRAKMHLDEPLPVRYGLWLSRALHGDLGASIATGRAVSGEVLAAVSNTLLLAGAAAL